MNVITTMDQLADMRRDYLDSAIVGKEVQSKKFVSYPVQVISSAFDHYS